MPRNTLLLIVLLIAAALALTQCQGPDPVDPAGLPRVILCLRHLGRGTLDDVHQAWQIREAIDASADPDTPAFFWLPATAKDQRLRPHGGVAAYAALGKPLPYCWDIVVTDTGPRIIHEGPLDAEQVLSWAGLVPRAPPAGDASTIPDVPLDVDFAAEAPELCGYRPTPELCRGMEQAAVRNIRELPGFEPIPKADWPKWCDRFPIERLAGPVYHTTEQVMGSCVGHSAMNGIEGPRGLMFGRRAETWLSAISMYHFIGRSPGSGAFIGDAADRLASIGILPADNSPDASDWRHAHQDVGGFYDALPAGYEATAECFRAEVYYVDDEEAWFAVTMRDGLRVHLGRSQHAISGLGVVCERGRLAPRVPTQRGRLAPRVLTSDSLRESATPTAPRYRWAYENSWGTDWGALGKSIGFDSRMYPGRVYVPVVHDGIPIPSVN